MVQGVAGGKLPGHLCIRIIITDLFDLLFYLILILTDTSITRKRTHTGLLRCTHAIFFSVSRGGVWSLMICFVFSFLTRYIVYIIDSV